MSTIDPISGGSNSSDPNHFYKNFWNWFGLHQARFRQAIQAQQDIESAVFDPVSERLREIHPGILQLCGMHANGMTELVFTADGAVLPIPFIEELVSAAPSIEGWIFTALKPPMPSADFAIEMQGYRFSADNIHFYPNESAAEPDLIDITVVYDNYAAADHQLVANGCYIMLDNLLGELAFSTQVDNMQVTGPSAGQQELIPISKLHDYLLWREKEFVERYDGARYTSTGDEFSVMQAKTADEQTIVALLNRSLLGWEGHASHPWVLELRHTYDETDNGGMPDDDTEEAFDDFDEWLDAALPEHEGYLRLVRETGAGNRVLYILCRDFRQPAKVVHEAPARQEGGPEMEASIYKDKYWSSFDRFRIGAGGQA